MTTTALNINLSFSPITLKPSPIMGIAAGSDMTSSPCSFNNPGVVRPGTRTFDDS